MCNPGPSQSREYYRDKKSIIKNPWELIFEFGVNFVILNFYRHIKE